MIAFLLGKDGRAAEGTSLLRTHTRKGIEGSNPSLSEVLRSWV